MIKNNDPLIKSMNVIFNEFIKENRSWEKSNKRKAGGLVNVPEQTAPPPVYRFLLQ